MKTEQTSPVSLMALALVSKLVLTSVSCVLIETVASVASSAYVALMEGQRARPLQGHFNNVPVLHSNQPEIVTGPGILIDTAAGEAIAAETSRPLRNAAFTFDGEFAVHMHHKYFPSDASKLGGRRDRGTLTLALIATNPGLKPVTLRFDRGSLKNSFEAPYLPNKLMGVKPLGKRPWNTGPGDATAVQMLRNQLDRDLPSTVVIPPRSRSVVVATALPARGIANGLLRGRSDGRFHMAVVAAEEPNNDQDLLQVLAERRLAPGRIYLNRIRQINNGTVFSRVGGVALGDRYTAHLKHDLQHGPLHVPLTSTRRNTFGTREVQVNPLASRMVDSALNNVGTYGVRFDVTLNLRGEGAHQLVLSHPVISGKETFTAFRGSLQIQSGEDVQEVHVGLRSGESLAISDLLLQPGQSHPVRVSLVYPADATPGHLLSVVPVTQLAGLQQRQRRVKQAQDTIATTDNRQLQLPAAPPEALRVPQATGMKPLPAVLPLLDAYRF